MDAPNSGVSPPLLCRRSLPQWGLGRPVRVCRLPTGGARRIVLCSARGDGRLLLVLAPPQRWMARRLAPIRGCPPGCILPPPLVRERGVGPFITYGPLGGTPLIPGKIFSAAINIVARVPPKRGKKEGKKRAPVHKRLQKGANLTRLYYSPNPGNCPKKGPPNIYAPP